MEAATFLLCPKNERQQSVNEVWPCILENACAGLRRYPMIALSAAFLGETSSNDITTMS